MKIGIEKSRLSRTWPRVALAAGVLILLSPALTLLGTQHLRDKMMQQLTLKAMAEKITRGEAGDEARALSLFRWMHEHLYTPPKSKPGGENIQEVLVRNIAWCSRQSDILAMLARAAWINGGYVSLFGYDDESHHTVSVLELDGEFRMLDPFYGYVFTREDGGIATLDDVRARGGQLKSTQFAAVRRLRGAAADDYFRLFEPAHDWEVHIPSAPVWLKYMDYYYDVFGDRFLGLYQRFYFSRSDTDLFTKGRIRQLTGQFEEALEDYQRILRSDYLAEPPVLKIDHSPVTKEVLDSETRFFRSQAYYDMKDYDACIRSVEEFLRIHPGSRWRDLACYYIGSSWEKKGAPEKAVEWYAMMDDEDLPVTPAPERLVKILDAMAPRGPEIPQDNQ